MQTPFSLFVKIFITTGSFNRKAVSLILIVPVLLPVEIRTTESAAAPIILLRIGPAATT
jgi:hypothetical protein